jgi:CMP-N-acetylneuraminic acid synthetase
MKKYKILALIPARGGSKGIKNKNIIDLAGKPLISYVIEAAKKSKMIDRIVCTTDSKMIADIARRCGAEVPFLRPAKLAQDSSPTYPALVHAVKMLEKIDGYKPDYIITLQPTYPLTQPEQIDKAIRKAIGEKADSVITAVALEHDCHPYNIRKVLPDGRVKFWKDKEHYLYPTRQSKPKFYTFGNVFVSSYDTILNKGKLEGEKNYLIEIDEIYHSDINTSDDLAKIEYILRNKKIKQ